ncbi:hypothetical protein EDB82DRAFT_74981 [Fusarium venenatum]|uniref:uncharacterized protein n=1 Tax=Fusarium venenatum TaxID=56646 RepID=UPI001DF64FF3|nr:hypothetical protein EDB82DRAFT_74981 [Fusarium venenatum]
MLPFPPFTLVLFSISICNIKLVLASDGCYSILAHYAFIDGSTARKALRLYHVRNYVSGSVPAVVLSVVSTTCCTTHYVLFLAYFVGLARGRTRALARYWIRGVTIPRHDNFVWQWETPLHGAISTDGYLIASQNLIYSFAVLVCFIILFVKHEIIWFFSTMFISHEVDNLVAGQ